MDRRSSVIRRIFAILLVIPVVYIFFKFNLPNPTFTKLDEILRYLFPIFIALAFLVDNWDKAEKSSRKIMKCMIVLIAALILGCFSGLGNKVNENQLMGAVLFGALLCSMSGISFYFASFQNRNLFENDTVLRKAYRFAIACFVFSFLQIPIWSVLTGHFPPKGFSGIGALIATIGVVLCLVGPAVPWLFGFLREMNEINKRRNESKK